MELGLVAVGLSSTIVGFTGVQSKQPYPLAEIRFCPESINKKDKKIFKKSQELLNKTYCSKPRYVLLEEWNKYGYFGSKISFKGDTLSLNRILNSDNSNQMPFIGAIIISSWLVTFTLSLRVSRFKKIIFIELEAEKTEGYNEWLNASSQRDVNKFYIDTTTNRKKDGIAILDKDERIRLGLTNEAAEKASARIEAEDFFKMRNVKHSKANKEIAENNKDTASAMLETARTEKRLLDLQNKQSVDNKEDSDMSLEQKQLIDKRNSLIKALKEHEGGWLWRIVDSLIPVWLTGIMGSGKTWTVASIALIREYCLDSKIYLLIDRHASGDNAEAWQHLNPSKTAEEIADIQSAMIDCGSYWLQRIKKKDENNQPIDNIKLEQIIIDEYTNYRELIPDVPDTWYKLHLSDPRKAKSQILAITHNDTNASYPPNTHASREAGTILIRKYSANGKTPLPRVTVIRGLVDKKGNSLVDFEGTIPKWMTPQNIVDFFEKDKTIDFSGIQDEFSAEEKEEYDLDSLGF